MEHLRGMFKRIPEMWQRPICRDLCTLKTGLPNHVVLFVPAKLTVAQQMTLVFKKPLIWIQTLIWTGFDLHQHTQAPWNCNSEPWFESARALTRAGDCTGHMQWILMQSEQEPWKKPVCYLYRAHTSLQSSRAVMHCKSDWLVWYWEIAR